MPDSNFWDLEPTESLVSATQTTKFKKVKATLKNQKIKSVELFFNKCTSFHVGSLDKMLQLANTRDFKDILKRSYILFHLSFIFFSPDTFFFTHFIPSCFLIFLKKTLFSYQEL